MLFANCGMRFAANLIRRQHHHRSFVGLHIIIHLADIKRCAKAFDAQIKSFAYAPFAHK